MTIIRVRFVHDTTIKKRFYKMQFADSLKISTFNKNSKNWFAKRLLQFRKEAARSITIQQQKSALHIKRNWKKNHNTSELWINDIIFESLISSHRFFMHRWLNNFYVNHLFDYSTIHWEVRGYKSFAFFFFFFSSHSLHFYINDTLWKSSHCFLSPRRHSSTTVSIDVNRCSYSFEKIKKCDFALWRYGWSATIFEQTLRSLHSFSWSRISMSQKTSRHNIISWFASTLKTKNARRIWSRSKTFEHFSERSIKTSSKSSTVNTLKIELFTKIFQRNRLRKRESKSVRWHEKSKKFIQITKFWSTSCFEFSFFWNRFLKSTSSFVTLSTFKAKRITKSLFESYKRKKQRSIVKLATRRKQLKSRKKRSCTSSLNIIIVVTFSALTSACSTLLAIKANGVASHDQRVFAHAIYANFQSTSLESAFYARSSRSS